MPVQLKINECIVIIVNIVTVVEVAAKIIGRPVLYFELYLVLL